MQARASASALRGFDVAVTLDDHRIAAASMAGREAEAARAVRNAVGWMDDAKWIDFEAQSNPPELTACVIVRTPGRSVGRAAGGLVIRRLWEGRLQPWSPIIVRDLAWGQTLILIGIEDPDRDRGLRRDAAANNACIVSSPCQHNWLTALLDFIEPDCVSDPMDRRAMVAGMRMARKPLHTPELAPYFDGDALSGPEAHSDDELLHYARQYGSTSYHPIGTARIGPAADRTAVVDDQLRVHGLVGLASAWSTGRSCPPCSSANTYCANLMMAEKASDMIRGRQALAPVDGIAA
jgi:choline dehydrogenase-like flavoprotein